LPENVVPISKSTTSVTCRLPDDSIISIKRQQVVVLPNFAMTDYAAQGKTRRYNVVDLGFCYTHQSYYTCLSQSAGAAGTVIVQGFDSKKITGGLSGFMRQEFRDLEILNKISEERFMGHLSSSVSGNLRNSLIRSYRIYKGEKLDTSGWHPHIMWRNNESNIPDVQNDGTWNVNLSKDIVSIGVLTRKPVLKSKVAAKHQIDLPVEDKIVAEPTKKTRLSASQDNSSPTGLTWDSRNYSCAFDSIITVLYHVWKESDEIWKSAIYNYSEHMQTLIDGFEQVELGHSTLEQTRNRLRLKLNRINPNVFPLGHRYLQYSDITELSAHIMGHGNCGGSYKKCPNCGTEDDELNVYFDRLTYLRRTSAHDLRRNVKLSETLHISLNHTVREICRSCDSEGIRVRKTITAKIEHVPELIMFECQTVHPTPEVEISIPTNSGSVRMRLCGLIFTGQAHFTSRVFDESGSVWKYDGMSDGREFHYEKIINLLTDMKQFEKNGGREIIYQIYKRIGSQNM
ncbi:hypothetical protein M413DRAFT_75826, partial [Hebeloma cylindrosporum]